uniref:Alkyl hydroperoxide reductase subunit C/ Thiol specific antioxidant domain-containing protein n=1 Tax=Gadus morhua TaxID=8049 RepID=A0A8C4ZYY4_GADMO
MQSLHGQSLTTRSARVLLVSYGSVEGARLWLEQTGCTFPMLLDPQRTIYRAFGLGSSYAKVLKFDFLLQMAECKVAGRKLPDMGGDFLLDQEGKVLLSHPSQHPLDRPAMADLLAAMPGKP